MPGKKICHRPGAGRHGRRGTAGKRERGGGLSGEGLSDEHHLNKVLKAMRQEPRKIWETVFQGQQQARSTGTRGQRALPERALPDGPRMLPLPGGARLFLHSSHLHLHLIIQPTCLISLPLQIKNSMRAGIMYVVVFPYLSNQNSSSCLVSY